MIHVPGSLVAARGREWVVLPESTDDLLVLRPLDGTDREIAGVYLPLEGADVRPAAFDLPDPARPGDYRSCRLLRDAVRLGFRSSAGPFRSFGRIAVEPRPYQLVPLLMALRLDPVRLLIADDVGIGKTIEAALVARELLDRGEVRRLAVLCPPHLAEQWQAELAAKFHIEAELVLLRTRSITVEAADAGQADALGEQSVLDLDDVESGDTLDVAPGGVDEVEAEVEAKDEEEGTLASLTSTSTLTSNATRRRLSDLARRAKALRGPKTDAKLARAVELTRKLLEDGCNPILFCRFIPTAEYVADELRQVLPKDVKVAAVTGLLPPAEREARIAGLGEQPKWVLVATDCLSEGINLQEHFDAVVHYDLSWNPTRHEQREGRVDRYGQPSVTVRAVTYYGVDNQIDGLVLDVLLRKHKTIRSSLGISVPLPANTEDVVQALMHGLLLRSKPELPRGGQMALFDWTDEIAKDLHAEWDNVTAREKQSRTLFAQRTVKPEEVAQEWHAAQAAVGGGVDVARFLEDVTVGHGGMVLRKPRHFELVLPEVRALREAAGGRDRVRACTELPAADGVTYLTRTHPVVEGLAAHVMQAALDPLLDGIARRCGATRTKAVKIRTTLLLVRLRYHIVETRPGTGGAPITTEMLAEDCQVLGFTGAPAAAQWLARDEIEALLDAEPAGNLTAQQTTDFIQRVVDGIEYLQPALVAAAEARGQEVLDAHRRVRAAARVKGMRHEVRAHLPPDVLGVYVLLPAAMVSETDRA